MEPIPVKRAERNNRWIIPLQVPIDEGWKRETIVRKYAL